MARKKVLKEAAFDIPQMEHNISIKRKHKLTAKQTKIFKAISDPKNGIIIIDGPAGTAKTYLAVYAGLHEVATEGTPILYLRSVAESSTKKLGHLPGTILEKFMPFANPLRDKLEEFLSPQDIKYLTEKQMVDNKPINYLRGADWKNKFVIIDEAQNLTKDELLTALTRAGEGTKIVLCGDLMQYDIRDSGLEEVCDKFSDAESEKMGILRFSLTVDDIVRSKLVKFIVAKFMQK